MLNDEENINASECQEPFEHRIIFLQKALRVHCMRVAVPVWVPVLVHVALAMVVAVVVVSMGLVGETTVTPLGQPQHWNGTGPEEATETPTLFCFFFTLTRFAT